jgi:hypothetical protein
MATANRRLGRALPLAAGGILLAGAALASIAWASAPRFEKRGTLFTMEQAGYVYSFDAAWRIERLDRRGEVPAADAPSTASRHPEKVERLRSAMLKHLRLAALTDIPAEGTAELGALRAVGYL